MDTGDFRKTTVEKTTQSCLPNFKKWPKKYPNIKSTGKLILLQWSK